MRVDEYFDSSWVALSRIRLYSDNKANNNHSVTGASFDATLEPNEAERSFKESQIVAGVDYSFGVHVEYPPPVSVMAFSLFTRDGYGQQPKKLALEYSDDGVWWYTSFETPVQPTWPGVTERIFVDPAFAEVGKTWNVAASNTLSTSTNGWAGYTIRQRVAPANLIGTGDSVRVRFSPAAGKGLKVAKAAIGYSTDGLDFDSAPVPLLFGGNAGFETDVDKSALSDTLPFTVESGKYLIVTFFIPTDAGTKGDLGSSGSTAPGWASSYREGDFVSSVPSTGFTAPSDRALSVSRIQFGTS